jgi:NADH:ubiquinone oxidoreductase subunit
MAWVWRIFTWWQVETFGTWLMTRLRGRQVGVDRLGNRYFENRQGTRRWVLYDGEVEASKVPPEWHAWLHHTVNAPPSDAAPPRPWEKEHIPNLTGTPDAYRQPGHLSAAGRRDRATGDYEPWRPETKS